MTKADLVETIYQRVGFSKKESAELVETIFEVIKDALVSGEKVKFSDSGTSSSARRTPARAAIRRRAPRSSWPRAAC
jgi:nucleoid DNA-binding protein